MTAPLPGSNSTPTADPAWSTRPRCTFVPPYLLRQLAGDDRPRARAEDPCGHTLQIDAQFRQRREHATRTTATTTAAAGADRWVIHSAGNEEILPGDVARAEGDPATEDPAVDEAYLWSQQVWDLYQEQFDRASFDGGGATVSVTVHFGHNYDNAFWDGEQLVFGDGDGEIFERFTKPADVLAHEFSHGVVQYTSGFVYRNQPGALNESIADVFAAMSVQHAAGQTADQASWLIGEGLFKPDIRARALRSMLEPGTAYDDPRLGKDPQVGSMADYVDTLEDNGGVHLNSGIPNRAFALAATRIGGPSWERAGQVWYAALTSARVGPSTDFLEFAEATVSAAQELFADSTVPQQVHAAWVEVGVLQGSVPVDIVAPVTDPDPSTDPDTDEEPESPSEGGRPADPSSVEPTPTGSPEKVAVRRSGGFTGQIRSGEILLGSDPQGEEVRRLLRQVDLQHVMTSGDAPDRFVYTVEVGDQSVTVGERDLPPDLQKVVQIVLGSTRTDLPGAGRGLG